MKKEILKFNKSLSLIDNEEISVGEGLSIGHYSDVIKDFSFDLPFTFCSSNNQAPYIDDISFSVVAREKVDLTAYGPNEKEILNAEKNKNFIPTELPPGFVELKKADV